MISKRAGEPCIIRTTFLTNMLHAPARLACSVVVVSLLAARALEAQAPDRRQLERIEQTLRYEGQQVVALADAAAGGGTLPADFVLAWHNDFLKAQTGTFVPFVVAIDTRTVRADGALLYVRASRSRPTPPDRRRSRRDAEPAIVSYPFEEVYPIALTPGQPVRIARGCSLAPG